MVAPSPVNARTQTKYEVRFDWASPGLASIAPEAGVIIIVDAISLATDIGGALAEEATQFGVPVLAATLRNRAALAQWVIAYQAEQATRVRVAVVAAGESRADGSRRFCVEDLLAAGAVIDALASVGIDYSSPEAAAACAAYVGLARATSHLFTASVSGQSLIDNDRRADVVLAGELDVSATVPVLRDGTSSIE